ncbi:MAG: ribosomal protein S18-alanine N-acetyltransferase [Proteobacteria bacterium]|nr:ribosomal protein S18-alanine N-acetyltransferase [Pseudomonadota bacterium]
MSAVPRPRQPLLLPMSLLHLDAVMAIEAGAYPFPWTHGNFVDSLAAGYDARVLYDDQGAILGYFVAMAGVEEMHLLNITVAPRAWHQGHGRFMLDALEALCRERGARQLWLEVRVSNERARAIYRRRGFAEVGRRKGYYPDAHGKREDAIVMSLGIEGAGDGLD